MTSERARERPAAPPDGGMQAAQATQAAQAAISPVERRHLESIRRWVYDHTGLHYPERKRALLYHRLTKLCRQLGIPGLRELDRHLKRGDIPALAGEVACAVSTNHTYFFREEKVMQLVRDQVVPSLPAQERWRLWSAASASGEEAYSVAIILAEVLGLERARERVAILGTDVDRNVIQQAEEGVYDQQRLDDVPDSLLRRYFSADGSGRWCVKPILKEMCVFRRLNLMSRPWPFVQRFHVVLCRNVLYYFDPEHQRDLVDRFYDVTMPGGWLLTSVTEPVQTLGTRWLPVASGVYRKA